jgi:predicted permease
MPTYFQDLSQAIRGLRKRPGFLIAALLTLTVGIGANVIVFTLVNALLLRPLPFGDRSDRVVTLHSTHPLQAEDWDNSGLSYPDLVDVQGEARLLEGVGGIINRNFTVTTESDAERLFGVSVTPNLFPLLGVEPLLGRNFLPEEGMPPGLESSVIITHGLWLRRFGGDPTIVGRSIVINERARTVVGVMPPGFKFPERSELYMPLHWSDAQRGARALAAIGVLQRRATVEQAQQELSSIATRLAERYPATNRDYGLRVMSFRDSQVGGDDRRVAATLMAAVGFVLLIACANLANLLLVRGASRQREMAIRASLGATRLRLVCGLLSEGAVLSIVGMVLGGLFAVWGLDAIVAMWPEELPYWVRLDVDGRIVAFTIGITALTTLAIGLLPALRASRPRVVEDLKEGSRGVSLGRSAQRTQAALAAAQVALCLALLVGANLMIRSFVSMQRADIGFDDGPMLTMRVYLAGDAFDDNRARAAFFDAAVSALRTLPGVTAAAATTSIPGDDGGNAVRLVADDRSTPGQAIGAQSIPVTPGLFEALGLRLIDGRTFTATESTDAGSDVRIINDRLARLLWPDGSALGRRVGIVNGDEVEWLRVVGVAPDLLYEEVGEQTAQSQLTIYAPYAVSAPRTMAMLIRTERDPATMSAPAREALRRLHGGLPVYDVRTMAEVRRFTTFEQRFFGTMMGAFAATALLLACVGVYALLAYAARRRTHEIGVRLALGASTRDVVSLFVRQGSVIGTVGLAAGLGLGVGVARALSGAVFAVDPFDPWLFAGTGAALLAMVMLAAYLPARRAARVDPMMALRID